MADRPIPGELGCKERDHVLARRERHNSGDTFESLEVFVFEDVVSIIDDRDLLFLSDPSEIEVTPKYFRSDLV